MHCRDRVQEWCHRMIEIFLDVARCANILCQQQAILLQSPVNTREHRMWVHLVVDRVKREHNVEPLLIVRVGRVADLKPDI